MDYNQLVADFRQPKAKIDFITIHMPISIKKHKNIPAAMHGIKDGQIKAPKSWHWTDGWLTVHDPSRQDLQFLIDHYHHVEINALEIAMDFALRDGSNDPKRLQELHSWLKICLYPQRHVRMKSKRRRKYSVSAAGEIRTEDSLRTKSGNETIYWPNPSTWEQVRLYIKTEDNGKSIPQHCVRLEVTLNRGGCQKAHIYRMGMLPAFIPKLRRYLSPFMSVAKGIKPKLKRTRATNPDKVKRAELSANMERRRVERSWQRYGAAWAVEKDHSVIPDTDTNRLIGAGLKQLREDLLTLKAPEKVADYQSWLTEIVELYQIVPVTPPPLL